MATLLFTAVGTLLGGPLGGALGAIAGRQVDTLVFGGGTREGPRLADLSVSTSSYGAALARHFGRMRVAGEVIWATNLAEHKTTQNNGKGKPSTTTYSYTSSFAVALASRPVAAIGRIWADGNLLRGAAGDLKVGGSFRFYPGHGDQPVDPLLGAAEAAGQAPAYRGRAYAVFEDLQLADFGNRIPSLTFEVLADQGGLSLAQVLDGVIVNADAAVPLDGIEGLTLDGPPSSLLGGLDPLFPVDVDAAGDVLVLRPDRLQTAPIALPEPATSGSQGAFGGNAGYAIKRTAPNVQPLEVLRYYDVDRDYQPGSQRATGAQMPGQPRSIDLPAALSAASAKAMIEATARRLDWSRQTISWRVTQLDPAVRPGARVTLPDQPGIWRVADWEWREHGVDLTLARLAPDASGATAASDAGRALVAADVAAGSTLLAAYELPWDGNPATPVPLLVAALSSQSPGWSGANLFVNQGDGVLQPLGAAGRSRAVVGSTIGALAPASPLLFDRMNSLTVQLASDADQLAVATMRQLSMGANRALVGSEIIQFAAAQPIGRRQWLLSGFWRGRGGTESAVGIHTAGETFALLDGSGTVLDPALVGTVPDTRIEAIGLGDTAPVVAPIALAGIGSRPLCPVHGSATLNQNGSLSLTWVRRARGAWLWPDAADTPLNEQSEVYDVSFGPVAAPLARWTVFQPSLLVASADIASLRAQSPAGPFTIVQRGDRGSSEPLSLPLG